MKNKHAVFLFIILFGIAIRADAHDQKILSKGQTIYIPAYSHIYIGNKGTPYLLAITLSIRNIDLLKSITITEVSYYESQGEHLKNFITEPLILNPLSTTRYLIHQKDKKGGSGANFIVKWESKQLCNPPIIEAVMIGTQSQQGISFTSRGQPIIETE